MKRIAVSIAIILVASIAEGKVDLVTLPRRESVQLTIYNSTVQTLGMVGGYGGYAGARGGYGGLVKLDEATSKALEEAMKRAASMQMPISAPGGDLTLVRERRNLTLKKGWNRLELAWANTLIDPTSLSLEPLGQADKIEIQQLVFPARVQQVGQWLIHSQVSGEVGFEITYFTSGLSWRAFYMGTLARDEKTMQLKGYVRVANNSGEEYENAQTRLIVGKVHLLDQIAELARRQYPYGSPVPVLGAPGGGPPGAMMMDGRAWGYGGGMGGFGSAIELLKRKEIKKEGLSEYFLYTIEGTETIPDQWGKRLLSFEAEDIKVESLYKYDEERWGGQTIGFVKFANDKDHNLGDTPIPDGDVRIYGLADDAGHLLYVGGTSVKYIPVNEEVELDLGPARLVNVEPMLMDFKTANYVFDTRKDIAGWDEIRTWKMEITNTRELPIAIEITRGLATAYWTLAVADPAPVADDAVSYKKHDATHARFELKLKPASKRTLGYTVTTYHGVREEDWTK